MGQPIRFRSRALWWQLLALSAVAAWSVAAGQEPTPAPAPSSASAIIESVKSGQVGLPAPS